MAKPRSISTPEEAYEQAVKLLARKARTVAEVEAELSGAGVDGETVAEVVGRLKSHRHLDDAALAEDQAFALLVGKGWAPSAAVQLLEARGIASRIATEAVEAAREGQSEAALLRAAFERRHRGAVPSGAALAKEARALGRLGYDEELIRALIERLEAGTE